MNAASMQFDSRAGRQASVAAADQFCQMLGRRVDFNRIEADSAGKYPVLLIGAVDVLSGGFRTFSSRRDRITAATVLASAAIPNLFRAVRLEDGTYWDGLFPRTPGPGASRGRTR
jgi:NTE family protein